MVVLSSDYPMEDSVGERPGACASEAPHHPGAGEAPVLHQQEKYDLGSGLEWEPASSFHRSVCLLDWDDTLLPSTWLSSMGLRLGEPVPAAHQHQLGLLQAMALRLLAEASSLAPVVIVTAAEAGWVERSAATFLPGLLPMLSSIKVVSARALYHAEVGDAAGSTALEWKRLALERELAGSGVEHILSFGDSVAERDAVRGLVAEHGHGSTTVKSFKLLPHPTLEQLLQQQKLIVEGFADLFWHPDSLDLMLHPTPA